MARKHDWDDALQDAIKSISIQPSSTGYISKAIALCGKGHVRGARTALDVASMFTNQDSIANHFLLLIKAITLFNADQHEEAMLLIKELAAACLNTDPLGCHVVEAYLRVQLGIKASDGAFPSKYVPQIYEDLTVLFGWDLESLCLTAHQKRCQAFLSASKSDEALQAHQCMMNAIDESTKASCLDWSNEFKERCSALTEQNDRILGAEIPGQDQDGYDTEPNFFHGRHQHSQISRPRPPQRPGHLKRLRLTITRTPRSAPPPAPATTSTPVEATTTLKKHLRRLFTLPPHRGTLPVVDVSFAKGRLRNAAAGAPGNPNTQQQPVVAQVDTGQHGRGRSCCCF
ncbi:uncharacterized protein EDB93DRAFT_204215 [Suillus bovinus]|uniref:uncharacterized protein n=1 Tax=Suillus bovinus TaxID=48563 RepID=UPI001B86282C|nr:uncharacterized protein EDB93DRAFT_204215 [Suillus bovinus]KAG2153627.1 hypothetical protein EDB93DRAFT_204215 [Suillus bovinus]